MGHKVNPISFRVGIIRNWDAKWYADKHYVHYLQEDIKLRRVIRSMYPEAGVASVQIDRQANNVSITIYTARPGILIGRGGQRVEEMRNRLEKLVNKRIQLNIREVQQPELDAHLVARSVADQMERRVAYRRAMKQTLQRSIQAGAKGVRIRCAGRLDGAEIARRVMMHEGRVPLHTIRADIDYGFTEAHTVMGRIGVKVWIYKGDVLPEKEEAEVPELVAHPVTIPVAELKQAVLEAASPPVEPVPAVAAEVKPKPAPTAVPEKPARPRRVRAKAAAPAETPPVAEAVAEKPAEATPAEKPSRPRRTRPRKIETAETVTAPGVEEKMAKPAARRTPRTPAKAKETPPKDTAEKQGDSNATTEAS